MYAPSLPCASRGSRLDRRRLTVRSSRRPLGSIASVPALSNATPLPGPRLLRLFALSRAVRAVGGPAGASGPAPSAAHLPRPLPLPCLHEARGLAVEYTRPPDRLSRAPPWAGPWAPASQHHAPPISPSCRVWPVRWSNAELDVTSAVLCVAHSRVAAAADAVCAVYHPASCAARCEAARPCGSLARSPRCHKPLA